MKAITKDQDSTEYFYHLLTEVDAGPLRSKIASLRYQILTAFIILLILVFFLSIFLSKKVTNKFHSLLEYSKKIAITDTHEKFKLRSSDEVDQVVYSLNKIFDMQLSSHENREKAEAYLDKYNTIKQFAHDIKSPLSVFGTVINNNQFSHNEEVGKILNSAVKRINDLSDDILEKVRKSNSQNIKIDQVVEFIKDIVAEKKFLLESTSKNIVFEITYDSSDDSVSINASIFKRILSNLINNSIEAISSDGKIKIELTANEKEVFVKVRDSGAGIPKEILSKVKNEGFSSKPNSTGIGLSHADQYMKSINGTMSINSIVGEFTVIELKFEIAARDINV